MVTFIKRVTSHIAIPIMWTALAIVLLCLPGSSFPGGGFFDVPNLDKLVHVILFGGIVVFWSIYYLGKNPAVNIWRLTIIAIASLTIALGICMEFIQSNYIPHRSFDTGDILANTISVIVFAAFFYFRKTI